MKIKIEATIDISDFADWNDKEEAKWAMKILKKHSHIMLWSNEIGDEIGSTGQYEFTLIKEK